MKVDPKSILAALKGIKAPVFKGDYNLTLVGIRSRDCDSNAFNDALVVFYHINNRQQMHRFAMTTDPGIYYRENPINLEGTAVLVPGHYKQCWSIGAHKGQYQALVQSGAMKVYRDADRDSKIDSRDDSIQTGIFGINLHRAGASKYSVQVDRWSAGCQVLADPVDFNLLMALVNKSAQRYGNQFSYSLLTEDQL